MKKTVLFKDFDIEEYNDVVHEYLDEALQLADLPVDKHHMVTGKFRIHLEWLSEDDCDCTGFQHSTNCPHWVISY